MQKEAYSSVFEERMRLLYRISSQADLGTSRQLNKALELTLDLLDLEVGIISHIVDDEYIVKHFYPEDSGLESGQTFPLGDTYCSITLDADEVVAIDEMKGSEYERHPCYEAFKLESYVGVQIIVENELYGTLNFSSSKPREQGFVQADIDYMRLLGEWVGSTIKREQLEEENRRQTELFKLISEKAADMVCLHEPDGTYEFVSPSVENILGYKPAELVGKSPYELFHPKDLERIEEESHRKVKEGEQVTNFQYRIRKKDGTYIWFETATEPIVNDEGEVIKLRTGSRDITDRKNLELVFKKTQELANVGGWEYEIESGELFWTDEVYRIHEIPVGQEVFVEDGISFYAPEARPVIEKAIQHAMETGEGWDLELPFITAKDNERWVRAIGRVHKNQDGEVYKMSGVFQDLTEQKKMKEELQKQNEQLKQLNSTKDKIYSVIKHDLKTPLNAITGFSELMLDSLEDFPDVEGAQKNLQYINLSAYKISELLENLVSWALLQSGELKPNLEEFSLLKVVEGEIKLLSAAAAAKKVKLDYPDDHDITVNGDRRMIGTVVRNLVSNAIKFCNENDTVEVGYSRNPSSWKIMVKDSGVGMTQEIKEHLFDEEKRPTKSGTKKEEGTGLGLILCKDLVDLHEGTIKVESEPSRGTTFEIEIPFPN